ncbi:MAG TPA: hypothetical protein VNA89_11110 [Gemmatimonadaceae bacterium]|nr:hypothetical protein [Gemmatimonadaceae bacterium]
MAARRTLRGVVMTLVAAATLAAPQVLAAQPIAPVAPSRVDSGDHAAAERVAIAAEVRALYADVHAKSWANVLNHFLPAKVTARWAPPVTAPAWALPQPTVAATDATRLGSGGGADCADTVDGRGQVMTVGVVGSWARVLVADCASGRGAPGTHAASSDSAARDELWLLRVSGRWKIVHLERDTSAAGGR